MKKKETFSIFPKRYGLFPYVFLIYLGMPATLVIQNEIGLKRILGLIIVLIFAVSYRQMYFKAGKKSFDSWLALQLIIIFFMSLVYDFNFLFLGFFSTYFIGSYTEQKKFFRAYIALCLAVIIPLLYLYFTVSFSLIFIFLYLLVMLSSPFGIRSMIQRRNLKEQLNEANEQIQQLIKREERIRIARDLHDTLGHTLSLLTLKSELVGKLIEKNPERARLEAKEMERTSRSALKQVRELVTDMRAITVAEELNEAKLILTAACIELYVEGDVDLPDVPSLTQNILSMCLREGVTNVVKHSQASHCKISSKAVAGHVLITIIDDGVGLTNTINKGNGLKGIEERLSLIEGRLILTSSQLGTELTFQVPIIVKQLKEGVAL
ncbi:sensor histidine kinase [Rummeliibacillus stabekisii]|uniref:sensor histidine kinase n=1 Tax=Rummeliibacillus stabekisii TaxID=241244 RepID=UPI0011677FDB|nr:sensor histidine kinase [Rummeliibacillus stabekisii]MBB5169582.1 two-component system sensor histidine kinase DesK [Rummeliibacillus stabekisii]GEL03839.1 sensor histidine kinase YvfT [Rummeliibacillus stabekisii]